MLKIYLDSCAVQRPLDTQIQVRIRLEAEAVLGLFAYVEDGRVELISSSVLAFEVSRNPLAERRELAEQLLQRASAIIAMNHKIAERAAVFVDNGIKAADALHLATAESAKVDYFCTCDDRFLQRARRLTDLKIRVVSPLELIEEIEP